MDTSKSTTVCPLPPPFHRQGDWLSPEPCVQVALAAAERLQEKQGGEALFPALQNLGRGIKAALPALRHSIRHCIEVMLWAAPSNKPTLAPSTPFQLVNINVTGHRFKPLSWSFQPLSRPARNDVLPLPTCLWHWDCQGWVNSLVVVHVGA